MNQRPHRRAVITGIHGQDAYYLAECLRAEGTEICGIARPPAPDGGACTLPPGVWFLPLHAPALADLFSSIQPDEIYHLAARSHAGESFSRPFESLQDNSLATLAVLEAARIASPHARILCISSSEIFGSSPGPLTPESPHAPRTPYGCAKSCAFHLARVYREAHQLHVAQAIPFNHESPRRPATFVTRKISLAAARAAIDPRTPPLRLGNLDSQRDWGWAPEFVQAFLLAIRHPDPGDHIVATGSLTSVREFARAAFEEAGFHPVFSGSGPEERAADAASGRILLEVSPEFFRPADPAPSLADTSRTLQCLGWSASTAGTAVARALVRTECKNLVPP